MCPFCFMTVAAIAAGVVSASGLTAMAVLKRTPAAAAAKPGESAQGQGPQASR